MMLISIIQRIMSRARNLMHMKEVCDSGVNNAVRNKVTDFYVKIYIYFKRLLSVTLNQEKILPLSKHMIQNCTYKLFIVG